MKGTSATVWDDTKVAFCNLKKMLSSSDVVGNADVVPSKVLPSDTNCQLPSGQNQHFYQRGTYGNFKRFLNSGLLKRLLFHENGKWNDHPAEIVGLVQEDFHSKKAVTEVVLHGRSLLFDFVHMFQVDKEKGFSNPIAWIDDYGCCFSTDMIPCSELHTVHNSISVTTFEDCTYTEVDFFAVGAPVENSACSAESSTSVELKNGYSGPKQLDIEVNSVNICKTTVEDTEVEQDSGENVLWTDFRARDLAFEQSHGKLTRLVESEKVYTVVQNLLLLSLSLFIDSKDILGIFSIPPTSPLGQVRLKVFKKQAEAVASHRGDANIRYAWLASWKEDIDNVMYMGLQKGCRRPSYRPMYGTGLHLTPANHADISVGCSGVGKNGIVYIVLCRVILGKLERVHPGSSQRQPSSETYDNGIDNFQDPNYYVIWDSNVDSFVLPEYVVGFRVPPSSAEHLFGNTSISGYSKVTDVSNLIGQSQGQLSVFEHQENKQLKPGSERSRENSHSVPDRSMERAALPGMPFSMLFAAISTKVSSEDMDLINICYGEFKRNKVTKLELLKRLRQIVGDKLLKSIILQLQQKFPLSARRELLVRR